MQSLKKLIKQIQGFSPYSKLSVEMGALMMIAFYITGIAAYAISQQVPNYFAAMSVFRGCMEAAPASLVSGICAAVICDLSLKSKK